MKNKTNNNNHISKYLGLDVSSHSEIDFVDITLKDTKLYLDPCLIEENDDEWSQKADVVIKSYFKEFYGKYRGNATKEQLIEFFKHSSEINCTKLGSGNGNNGNCKTAEGMYETFKVIPSLIQKNINLTHAIDLQLLIKGIAEDRLSDIITNALFKVLNDFTIEQCNKYGIPLQTKKDEYFYWNEKLNNWTKYEGEFLVIEGKVILLVPKNFVRRKYFYNASQYFSKVIIDNLRREKEWQDEKSKPFKKSEIKQKILAQKEKIKIASTYYTELSPSLLSDYHNIINNSTKKIGLPDDKLDEILYGKKIKKYN